MAAQYGCVIAVGTKTGRTYYKDIYSSDVANARINWDSGQGASSSSEEEWLPPEPVIITDVMFAAAMTRTKHQILVDAVPTGDILRNSLHLATVAYRPRLAIPCPGRITMVQLT